MSGQLERAAGACEQKVCYECKDYERMCVTREGGSTFWGATGSYERAVGCNIEGSYSAPLSPVARVSSD